MYTFLHKKKINFLSNNFFQMYSCWFSKFITYLPWGHPNMNNTFSQTHTKQHRFIRQIHASTTYNFIQKHTYTMCTQDCTFITLYHQWIINTHTYTMCTQTCTFITLYHQWIIKTHTFTMCTQTCTFTHSIINE